MSFFIVIQQNENCSLFIYLHGTIALIKSFSLKVEAKQVSEIFQCSTGLKSRPRKLSRFSKHGLNFFQKPSKVPILIREFRIPKPFPTFLNSYRKKVSLLLKRYIE